MTIAALVIAIIALVGLIVHALIPTPPAHDANPLYERFFPRPVAAVATT